MSTETRTVAIDDGYAQIKVVGRNDDGTFNRLVFRSSIRSGRDGLGMVGGEGALNAYSTEEGEEFTVSDHVVGENTQFNGFHTSSMNRVLVHHGIREAGFGGTPVDLMVGLPVADYFREGSLDRAKIEAKKANLTKEVRATMGSSENQMAKISSIRVGCQAVAAFIDYALDDNLDEKVDMGGTVAIIDIGGRTTDIAVVVAGQTVDFTQSGTADIGALDVYAALQDRIRAEFNVQKTSFPLTILDRAVRNGTVRLFGKEQDVQELVKSAVREIQTKIEREIDRRIGQGAALEAVVFVGGGGNMFKDVHSVFPHGHMIEDPEFSNARGMWKYREIQRRSAKAEAA